MAHHALSVTWDGPEWRRGEFSWRCSCGAVNKHVPRGSDLVCSFVDEPAPSAPTPAHAVPCRGCGVSSGGCWSPSCCDVCDHSPPSASSATAVEALDEDPALVEVVADAISLHPCDADDRHTAETCPQAKAALRALAAALSERSTR